MADQKTITSMMAEDRLLEPSKEFVSKAAIKTMDEYKKMYKESIEQPEKFWGKVAEELLWDKKWDKFSDHDFANAKIKFFVGGKINAAKNCLDKHLNTPRKDKVALRWVGEPVGESRNYTYAELHREVCKLC